MDTAQKDLTDTDKTPDAQAAQTNALAALNQANKLLADQIAQAEQQPPDANDLASAQASLQKSQDEAGDATADAAPAPPNTPNTDSAASALANADKDAADAANTPGLPQDAAQDVKNAQAEIAQGKQAAAAKDAAGTASHASAAQKALASAQSKVAMAAAALAANSPGKNMPSGKGSPQPPPPGVASSTPSKSTKIAGGDNKKYALHDTEGNDKFIALAARKRAADTQSQQVERPQEYAPMIEQYLKNLADQTASQ
jgi:hypothetical protein